MVLNRFAFGLSVIFITCFHLSSIAQTITISGDIPPPPIPGLGTLIPDNDPAGGSVNVTVSGMPDNVTITDIEVRLGIFHEFLRDLRVEVIAPTGDDIVLMNRPNDDSNLFRTAPLTFTDASVNDPRSMGSTIGTNEAVCEDDGICDYFPSDGTSNPPTFADLVNDIQTSPSGSLAANGNWTVRVIDNASGDEGNFSVQFLRITYLLVNSQIDATAFDDNIDVFGDGTETVVWINNVEVFRNDSASIGTLTVNGGDGNDAINVPGVGTGFNGNMILNGESDIDTVNFQDETTNLGSGNLNVTSEQLNIDSTIETSGAITTNTEQLEITGSIITTGSGSITTTTTKQTVIRNNAVVETVDGVIDMSAGTAVAPSDSFIGLNVTTSGSIRTTGTGDIFLNGTGIGTETLHSGVSVNLRGFISSSSGNITITGVSATTTASGNNNNGIRVEGVGLPPSFIESVDGNITLIGTGGAGTGSFNSGVNVVFNGAVRTTGTGSIIIDGTGGAGANRSYGFNTQEGTITSAGGGITIDGIGSNVPFALASGITILDATISDTNGGDIQLTGTGGAGGSSRGIFLSTSANITTTTGNIIFDGTATIDGGNGVFLNANSALTSTSGAIDITGTAVNETSAAVNFRTAGVTRAGLQTAGDITITAPLGKIITAEGANAFPTFEGSSIAINGVFAPGQSPGTADITGNLLFGSDDVFEAEINDFTTSGTDYDQIKVTGTVGLNNATLTIVDNVTATPVSGNEVILVDNDGTDPVVGTFDGLANGDEVILNGTVFNIQYDGGDGNDVVLEVNESLSNDDFNQPDTALTVYPNPIATGQLLNITNVSPGSVIDIYDSLGRHLNSTVVTSSEAKIPTWDLTTGLYVVQINKQQVVKVLVE